MGTTPKILVVDDEQVVCASCKRIFEPKGFSVDVSTDSREGLELARHGDYQLILLDIKMPVMDGIEFLKELRATNPDVPVLMVTGYASIPTASAAMRLGAVDYIPKPFTPEEITQAVQRVVGPHLAQPVGRTISRGAETPVPDRIEPWKPADSAFTFLDEAWLKRGKDDTVRIGMFLPRAEADAIQQNQLAHIGDILHQGLPQAAFLMKDGSYHLVPSPVSGTVVEVHGDLRNASRRCWDDPCHEGWMARVRPSRQCEPIYPTVAHLVLLLSSCRDSTVVLCTQLEHFGCTVHSCCDIDEASRAFEQDTYPLVVLDARSLGESGPTMARQLNESFEYARILVLSDGEAESEARYRAERIFYFAVDPFADLEIIDLLSAAFHRPELPATAKRFPVNQNVAVGRIRITCPDGRVAMLMTDGELLERNSGLGLQLAESNLGDGYTIETMPSVKPLDSAWLIQETGECDRLFILRAVDKHRLAGSLIIDSHDHGLDWVKDLPVKAVSVLEIQPMPLPQDRLGFDVGTTRALTRHILHEMTTSLVDSNEFK